MYKHTELCKKFVIFGLLCKESQRRSCVESVNTKALICSTVKRGVGVGDWLSAATVVVVAAAVVVVVAVAVVVAAAAAAVVVLLLVGLFL